MSLRFILLLCPSRRIIVVGLLLGLELCSLRFLSTFTVSGVSSVSWSGLKSSFTKWLITCIMLMSQAGVGCRSQIL